MDVKKLAHELRASAEKERKIKIKLGHIHQAMAAGFGYRTYQGMQAEVSVVGRTLQLGDFEKAYFDARLSEILQNEETKSEKTVESRVSFWT